MDKYFTQKKVENLTYRISTFFILSLFAAQSKEMFKQTLHLLVAASCHCFWMPLNSDHWCWFHSFNCFDDTIMCSCCNSKAICNLFYCLMMEAVDIYLLRQERKEFAFLTDFCHMTWISAWRISNMFKFGCSLCFQVLIKGSAVCYIDCLTAFADTQNRFTQFFTGVDQVQIKLVYFQINKAKFINWLFSI